MMNTLNSVQTLIRSVKPLILTFSVFLCISILWGSFNFVRFSTNDLVQFGFTPKYLDVVETSLKENRYTSTMLYSQYYLDKPEIRDVVIDEVQREPLYPFVTMIVEFFGHSPGFVVYLQFLAMILAITCWATYCFKTFGWKVTLFFYILLSLNPVLPFYTSILYPYAFQFLFLTLGILSLVRALQVHRNALFLLSGVSFAFMIYERNVYLFLPLLLCVVLFILNRVKFIKVSKLSIAVLLCSSYLVLSPWLIRDAQLGVIGMSQMTGYTLGYTYGHLQGSFDTLDKQLYEENLAKFGSDAGTLGFIGHKVLDDGLSYTEADKSVATIVLDKMKQNPGGVVEIVKNNLINYPEMFVMPKFGVKPFNSLFDYYVQNVSLEDNLVLSYLFFACAIGGIFIMFKHHRSLAVIGMTCLVYNILVNTVLVIFDVKYRGALDLMLYIFAGYFILMLVKFIRSHIGILGG